jgi:hypothetical protein
VALQIAPAWQTAWDGTAQRLFRPFNGRKWLWLAFSAWLANMLEGGGGGSFSFPTNGDGGEGVGPELERTGRWLTENLGCVLAIAVPVFLFVIAVIVALSYLKARAEFVFLDQVVGDHTRFEPAWHAYRREGKSVWAWRWGLAGAALAAVAVIIGLGILLWLPARHAYETGIGVAVRIALTVPILLLFLLVILTAVLAGFFLKHFVIPIMARHHLRATEAWRRFLPLLRANGGSFALYTLITLGIWLGVGTAVVLAGCLTCCIGFIVLALPWLGTLPLLPVLVFFRLFSVAFLAQLGAEYDLLGSYEATS